MAGPLARHAASCISAPGKMPGLPDSICSRCPWVRKSRSAEWRKKRSVGQLLVGEGHLYSLHHSPWSQSRASLARRDWDCWAWRMLTCSTCVGGTSGREELLELRTVLASEQTGDRLPWDDLSLGMRRRFLPIRGGRSRNSLPRRAMGAKNLTSRKKELDELMKEMT